MYLNPQSACAILEDRLAASNALIEARDAGSLMTTPSALAQPGDVRFSCYCRDVNAIVLQTHDDFVSLLEAQAS